MPKNVTQKLIEAHLLSGKMQMGEEIGLKIDQTLSQDATGTLVMLELEAMRIDKVKTELSAQYVDHNLLQTDFKNADDHLFLYSACRRFGIWYSRAGNGVSHPIHMERFGIPGKTLLGADSHTPAAGSLGMLAIGAGGLDVALAMAGEAFYLRMPKIWGVKLLGELPDWVSAKDIILEMLRRHSVKGAVGKIIEYYGPGLASLSAMDRHVIANMGAELGATSSVFPSDPRVREFLRSQGRENDWLELVADEGASYDEDEEIQLADLEPLIACPSSPDNVVPVQQLVGREIYQCMIGSSANPGLRDFAVAAQIVKGKQVHPRVSLDINPSSRQILENLVQMGYMAALIRAGGRIHQSGCNGCIGMGQAPATQQISLRTVPRNFPGRSGTQDDLVYLCSPETAAASALTGFITDPRSLDIPYSRFREPEDIILNTEMLLPPLDPQEAHDIPLVKGPNIVSLPIFDPLPDFIEAPVLIKVGHDISTDAIMPAGADVLPFRSNIPAISRFVFRPIDEDYYRRAIEQRETGSLIVGGENYGQGSSREHAALAPRYLGVRVVLAQSFARIHWQNLVNFGILALTFRDPQDYQQIEHGNVLVFDKLRQAITEGREIKVHNKTKTQSYVLQHSMSPRHIQMVLTGSLIKLIRERDAMDSN